MNEAWAEFTRLYIKAMGEKLDKEILDSEDDVRKKTKYPRVVITHDRPLIGFRNPAKNGGRTCIELQIRKGVGYGGAAYCWSGDVYNKRKGKSIAFGRLMAALVALDFPQYLKTQKWIHSKIGKIDILIFLKALRGERIE